MTLINRKALLAILSGITGMFFLVTVLAPSNMVSENNLNRLIDIPFKFLHLPVCKKSQKFVILVHTSPANIERRQVLRESWAAKNETEIDVFFVTGVPKNINDQKTLEKEIIEHNNIIQGDFLDTYHNLTYKHVMGLKYVFFYCPEVEYVVKIDDDVFVNTHVVSKFFDVYTERFGQTKDILCTKRVGHSVLREGKWAVQTKDFPDDKYPPHCLGFAIIYPRKAVELLYLQAQRLRYFWIDDVHVSGSVAKAAGVGQIDISLLTMSNDEMEIAISDSYDIEMRPVLFGPVETDGSQIRSLSKYFKHRGRRVSILDYLE